MAISIKTIDDSYISDVWECMEFVSLMPDMFNADAIFKIRDALFSHQGFIANNNGKIVGFITVYGCEITWMAVHPDYMRKGIGKKLINEVINILDGQFIFTLVMANREKTEKFYQSCGFETMRTLHMKTWDALLMVRSR